MMFLIPTPFLILIFYALSKQMAQGIEVPVLLWITPLALLFMCLFATILCLIGYGSGADGFNDRADRMGLDGED